MREFLHKPATIDGTRRAAVPRHVIQREMAIKLTQFSRKSKRPRVNIQTHSMMPRGVMKRSWARLHASNLTRFE